MSGHPHDGFAKTPTDPQASTLLADERALHLARVFVDPLHHMQPTTRPLWRAKKIYVRGNAVAWEGG